MVNTRHLLMLSLLGLGSCAPMPPSNTSINIYTNTDGKVVERKLSADGVPICRSIDTDLVKNYQLPRPPDLEGIPSGPNQEKLIMQALVTHIKILRADFKKVQDAANCGQRIPDRQ